MKQSIKRITPHPLKELVNLDKNVGNLLLKAQETGPQFHMESNNEGRETSSKRWRGGFMYVETGE